MGVAVSIGVLAAPTAKAESNETLSVRVLAVNQAQVRDVVLRQAELQASRIFSTIKITVLWTNIKPGEPYDEAAAQVSIIIVPDSRIERDPRRLGTARSGYMVAYAFYKRMSTSRNRMRLTSRCFWDTSSRTRLRICCCPTTHIPRMVSCVRNGTARNSTIWQKGC